jgi:enoyl-CoA hydratase/carnithine racemase
VVLKGAGKAFCTGGDVKEYADDFMVKPRNCWKLMGVFSECHDVLRNILVLHFAGVELYEGVKHS